MTKDDALRMYREGLEEEIRLHGWVSPEAEYRISGEALEAADEADEDGTADLWDQVLEELCVVRAAAARSHGLEEDEDGEYPYIFSLRRKEAGDGMDR